MVYKYLLVQIHSSDLFFWVSFIYCANFFLKKSLWSFFMDGVQLPQGYRATTRRHSTFTTKLPSILSFPKKFLPTIFKFSRIDSKFWCDVLRDLVPFVQFEKYEKQSWRSVTFGKYAGF